MKKQSILLLIVAVGAAIISFGQGTPGGKPPQDQEVVQMRNQMNALEARIRTLESRMKNLETSVEQLQHPHLQPMTTPGANLSWPKPPASESTPTTPPNIWGERQINGWTFYIVPCADHAH